jgi:hypothetical protein
VLHSEGATQWRGGAATWTALSDASAPDAARKKLPGTGSETLALRLDSPGTRVLFAHMDSNASIHRLLNAHEKELPADVLILTPGRSEHWPLATDQFLSKSAPRRVIAQDGDADSDGATNLASWCQAQSRPIWFVKKEGTVRVGRTLQAFAGGLWRELK